MLVIYTFKVLSVVMRGSSSAGDLPFGDREIISFTGRGATLRVILLC